MSTPLVPRSVRGLSLRRRHDEAPPIPHLSVAAPPAILRRACHMALAGLAVLLAGCASLSPEGDAPQALSLVQGQPLVGDARPQRRPDTASAAQAETLLAGPLDQQAAVRIALAQSPRMQAAFAALQLSDAERAEAATLPNPVFSFSRLREGRELELDRLISFNVVGLLTLPWRARWAGQQQEAARLDAAQAVLQLAADTRRAWLRAVADRQSAVYLRDVRDAAEAGATLAQRMQKAGNWPALQAAREQLQQADAQAQLARAEQAATASREALVRLLGLDGAQAARLTMPDRLPDLPASLPGDADLQAQALRDRLDLRAARADAAAIAEAQRLTRATRFVDVMELGVARNTTFTNDIDRGRSTQRGWEIGLPIPLFDFGQARSAQAEARYLQAAARVRGVALAAASEVREAEAARRHAWQIAHRYQAEVLPLQRQVNDEMVLRYNAMGASVWQLLAEARASARTVDAAMQAQRDFWLAEVDLQMALTGSSPAGLSALRGAGTGPALASTTNEGGH
ncbi:TolC family protein [Pseudacidovorax sp.]|uniref:TolC family protein n=1 Tax=Pseudacidovorax sp. TaxID=1934311 RepID=UPI0025F31AD2|nr:TolC family protein [Pseudacidovorax sp.]